MLDGLDPPFVSFMLPMEQPHRLNTINSILYSEKFPNFTLMVSPSKIVHIVNNVIETIFL